MTKPFFITSEGAATTPRPGVAIAMPFSLGGGGVAIGPAAGTALRPRNSSQVLAITAAAAIENRAEAFALARNAKEKPEDVLTQAFDELKISAVLAEVQIAQDDSAKNYEISAMHRAAAGAVGANPRLVAAAAGAIDTASAGEDARLWVVHLVDPGLLDKAARAAGRAEALEPLDTGTVAGGTNTRLQQLEKDRDELKSRVSALEKAVEKVKPKPPA